MDETTQASIRERYETAITHFVDKVRNDVNVIAIIVSGSVAYDVVWEKSDVDMSIIIRDQPLKGHSLSIIEDGITFNVYLMQRSTFMRGVEREFGGSFFQSYMAKGRLVYTADESFHEIFEDISRIGEDDKALSILYSISELLGILHKVEKWLVAREDPLYAQYFLLKSTEVIAGIELCLRGIPQSRSAVQKALELNPTIMQTVYLEPMKAPLPPAALHQSIAILRQYIDDKRDLIGKPVLDCLSDGQIHTVSMIAKHFRTESHFIVDVLDDLADHGVIDKVCQSIKLTPKSRFGLEEIGYACFHA